ncbi:unnamed protein product [Chironomus riparius]|uniref:Uncharacterized protein n=1 Tax=Chironomus riparius TaxID=315576 RepID=A0A9N9RTA1_9DIPT|nr:unnamed protein product [Chironomus riparius]
MKVISQIIQIVFLLSLFGFFCDSIAQIQNSSQNIGDTCDLGNNQNGICQELRNCQHSKKLFVEKKFADIKFCKPQGYIPIACCPGTSQ